MNEVYVNVMKINENRKSPRIQEKVQVQKTGNIFTSIEKLLILDR